jgi:hypothetical protein
VVNPPNGDIDGEGDDMDASILHVPDPGTTIVYTALESWQIDADGDETAEDHVFFVLSATGSTAVIDTIDISIGDTVFGEGALGDGLVNYDAANNTNDERFTLADFPSGKVVTLGTHNFLVEFETDPETDEDDACITARWYIGTLPVDVDNDQLDESLDFVLIDHNSDGLFTVFELDGNDSGGYSIDEVHKAAGAMWMHSSEIQRDTPEPFGSRTTIAATDDETLFVAYYDESDGALWFTRSTNAGLDWSEPAIVDGSTAGTDVGMYASIAAYDEDTLYLTYYDADGRDLKVAVSTNGGSSWTLTAIDASGDVGRFADVAVIEDPSTTAFVSYYDATNGDLKFDFTTDGGGSWTDVTVDSVDDVGEHTSISALEDDDVYVSYYNATSGDLKFARTVNGGPTPGDWTTVTVDSTDDVGQFTSIRAVNDTTPNDDSDEGDTVFISYYDATNGDLKFSKTLSGGDTPGEWTTIATVDSSGDVGRFTSLSAAEESTVFIGYYDSTLRSPVFVSSTDGGTTFGDPVFIDQRVGVGEYVSVASYRTHMLFAVCSDPTGPGVAVRFTRSPLLLDAIGHRLSLEYALDASEAGSAALVDGRIITVAQLNEDQWLFVLPRDAILGPAIEQSQIRIKVKVPDDHHPGFYTATLTVVQID